MKLIKVLSIYLLLVMAIIGQSGEISGVKVQKAPVIDGRLDDEAWKSAKPINGFNAMGTSSLAKEKTVAKIVYTDSAIYFGIECYVSNIKALKSQKRIRDDRVWDDDCVEVMVDINNKKSNFYHIVINPSNSIYDSYCDQGGSVSDPKWNGKIKTATYVGKDIWSCEIMIPFYSLDITPEVGSLWGINICRENKDPSENSSVARNGEFKIAGGFPCLKLDVDFSPFCWSMSTPDIKSALKDGNLNLQFSDLLANFTGKQQIVQVECLLISPKGNVFSRTKEISFKKDEKKTLSWDDISLVEHGEYQCYLSIIDNINKIPLAMKQFPLNISYVPMAIDLLVPWYKNAIFATQKVKNVVLDVNFNLSPVELINHSLEVFIRCKGSVSAIEIKKFFPVKTKNSITFDADKLPGGKLEIVAKLLDNDGNVKAETVQAFRKLAYKKDEVWRGQDMQWYVDGNKFFMLGAWGSGDDYVKEFNCILLNHKMVIDTASITDTHIKGLLSQGNMRILGSLFHIPKEYMPGYYKEVPVNVKTYFSDLIDKMRRSPQLFAYYLSDEPEVMGETVNGLKYAYDLISELDPYHPVIVSNDTISGMKDFAGTGDINGLHCYPAVRKTESMYDFEKVVSYMEAGNDYFRDKKHKQSMAYLHAGFNYGDYGQTGVRIPTYEELRNQDLLAVIMGSRGLIYFNRHVDHYPEIRIGTPYLLQEQAFLAPAAMAPDADITIQCSEPKVKYMLKKLGNDYWLFVSNTTRNTGDIEFTVPALADKTLRVISEDRTIKLKGSRLSDNFTPFQVHVYTTDMADNGLKTIKAINDEIDKVNAKRRKTGNLAFQMFEGDHVAVTASSNLAVKTIGSRIDMGLWHVTDGVIDKHEAGYPGVLIWNDATPNKLPDWIELKLDKPETISKVIVYPFEKTIKNYQVQAFVNGKWLTVAEVADKQEDVIETVFSSVKTDRIRIWVTAANGPIAKITEIELYN